MHFIEFSGRDRKDVSIEQVRQLRGPVMVFLGGLLHVQDIDTAGGFPRYLEKLRGASDAHILMPLDETCNDTPALDAFMVSYGKGRARPGAYAQDIHQALYAPLIEACDLSSKDSIAQLKAEMARISLVGYSYGTNVVQQLGECVATHLSEKLGAAPNKGIRIYDICRSVKAVNIGPVARYNHIESDGTIRNLEHTDPYFSEAQTIFSQMSFLMHHDKIVQKTFGRELLGDKLSSDIGVENRDTATTSLLIDFIADPTHKAIGYMTIPTGPQFAKIITSYDFILHDLRSYMNVREKQGDLIVFPTLSIAPVLRKASESMFTPGLDGRDWIEAVRADFNTPQKKAALVSDYQEKSAEFRAAIQGFEQREYWEAIAFLKDFVEGKTQATAPMAAPTPDFK